MKKYRITHQWFEDGSDHYEAQFIYEDCIEHAHVHFYNQIQTRELELGIPAEMIDPNFIMIGSNEVWKLTEIKNNSQD